MVEAPKTEVKEAERPAKKAKTTFPTAEAK